MPRRSGHRDWANAHHRAQMERKRPGSGRSKGDRVILLLSTIFVVSMGLTVFLWPSASTSSPETGSPGFACQVSSVTDGDTLRCADGTRVRLHAIAARERDETCSPGHPCPTASAASATAKLAELAGGRPLHAGRLAPAMTASPPSATLRLASRSTARWCAAGQRWCGSGSTGRRPFVAEISRNM